MVEKIFGPEREGSDRQLEKIVELHDVCSSPYNILMDEMGVACGIYEAEEKCVQGLGREI